MQELIDFIAEETRTKPSKIHKDSLLEKDLGLYGDEAGDFLTAYSKRYNVDISQFPFSTYFNPEGMPLMRGFFNQAKTKELSVNDLYEGIQKGSLSG